MPLVHQVMGCASSVTAEFSTGHRFLPILFCLSPQGQGQRHSKLMVTPFYVLFFFVKNLLCMFRAFLRVFLRFIFNESEGRHMILREKLKLRKSRTASQ